jgi:hypothetical protein
MQLKFFSESLLLFRVLTTAALRLALDGVFCGRDVEYEHVILYLRLSLKAQFCRQSPVYYTLNKTKNCRTDTTEYISSFA